MTTYMDAPEVPAPDEARPISAPSFESVMGYHRTNAAEPAKEGAWGTLDAIEGRQL